MAVHALRGGLSAGSRLVQIQLRKRFHSTKHKAVRASLVGPAGRVVESAEVLVQLSALSAPCERNASRALGRALAGSVPPWALVTAVTAATAKMAQSQRLQLRRRPWQRGRCGTKTPARRPGAASPLRRRYVYSDPAARHSIPPPQPHHEVVRADELHGHHLRRSASRAGGGGGGTHTSET